MTTSRRLLTLGLLLTCLVAGLGTPPAAAASTAVYVIKVNDGDTMDVSASNDGTTDYRVRLIGINTPEGHWDKGRWSGTCHSRRAHNRLEGLVEGKWVELRASDMDSTGWDGRKLRYVHLRNAAKTDVNALMLREGLAVAYPNDKEPARNGSYIRLARAAAANKRVIWDPSACKWGPYQNAKLTVAVRWYMPAVAADATNADLNEEYVRIENKSGVTIPLKGWVLRDGSSFYYHFGDSAKIAARGSVTVHTGKGTARGTTHKHYYWRQSASVFPQERLGIRKVADAATPGYRDAQAPLGDGAYLYDPHRDLRAYMTYPCLDSGNETCTDPKIPTGALEIDYTLRPAGTGDANSEINKEITHVTNTSGERVYLDGYKVDSWPWNYVIRRGTYLDPNETLNVHSGKGTSTRLQQFWGLSKHIYWTSGRYVEVRRMPGQVAAAKYW